MTNSNDILSDDLQALSEHLEDYDISSYFLLALNKNKSGYYIAQHISGDPNDIIATLELMLLDLKNRVLVQLNDHQLH